MLNLLITVALGWLVSRRSRLAALLAVAVSTALISLRGYLVPGTPTLTKRYLPSTVLRWFGKEPEPAVDGGLGTPSPEPAVDAFPSPSEGAAEATNPTVNGRPATDDAVPADTSGSVDLETFLVEHGVIEPCADDLYLTATFESAWFDEVEPLVGADVRLDVDTIVDAFGIDDAERFELVSRNDGYLLRAGATQAGSWPSEAALLADVATNRALDSWIDGWGATSVGEKGKILNGVRMFLERCPSGSDVRVTEETVESCCRPHSVFAVVCEDTGERLFEHAVKG